MSQLSDSYTNQQQLVDILCEGRRYPHAAKSVQVIETHISWVLLAGRYAYKIKKAINLGFLDYSELQERRFCCAEEIRLNRRTAPQIYLDAIPIGGTPDSPVIGAQPAIEYAVRMRRFQTHRLMDRLLLRGQVAARHIDNLASTICHFHAGIATADTSSVFGTATSVHASALQNFEQLFAQLNGEADRTGIAELKTATETEFDACKELFEARRMRGFVRECHGDLHLGNIVLFGDEPVPFDCIEFNPALRWIDVMDEVAFTVMDLLHRNHADFAWRLLNAYLEAGGDYDGLSVLRFYLAYRAAVRAKVSAIRAGQSGISARARLQELSACRSYLALASQCLAQRRPALIITHGLPGSGKTTFSQLALQQMGAIRIRSDVERKRLFGLGALDSSRARAGDIYSAEATQRTYAHLLKLAGELLKAGFTVIVDAAFLKQEERETFRRLAQELSLPFVIASLHAPHAVLRARIRQRQHDASEADVQVLEMLQAKQQPLASHELACAASFTTGEAPDSEPNSQNWHRLFQLLGFA